MRRCGAIFGGPLSEVVGDRPHLRCLRLLVGVVPVVRDAELRRCNEWGESNYVEPDLKYGRIFLDVLRELLVTKK